MKKQTKHSRRRNKVVNIVEQELDYDWTPARVLVEIVNTYFPKYQEITISAIGQLIRKLVVDGVIEKKVGKLMGRTEVLYRKTQEKD